MTLSTVIGARPTAASRPRFDAIAAWFVEGAGDPTVPGAPTSRRACSPTSPRSRERCSAGSRHCGASASRSSRGRSPSPTTTSTRTCSTTSPSGAHSHRLRRLVIFSGDGRNFAEPLEQLVRDGTHVVVVAFSEVAGYAISSDLLEFIDIEDVPGPSPSRWTGSGWTRCRRTAPGCGRPGACATSSLVHRPPQRLTAASSLVTHRVRARPPCRSPTWVGSGVSFRSGLCRWGGCSDPFRADRVLRQGDGCLRPARPRPGSVRRSCAPTRDRCSARALRRRAGAVRGARRPGAHRRPALGWVAVVACPRGPWSTGRRPRPGRHLPVIRLLGEHPDARSRWAPLAAADRPAAAGAAVLLPPGRRSSSRSPG